MREGSYQDIDQRTFNFANRVIKMIPQLPNNVTTWKIGAQVIDSATSVNSNIVQARGGLSKKDFTHHLRISLKEARETKRWLEMIIAVGLAPEKNVLAVGGKRRNNLYFGYNDKKFTR